MRFTLDCSWEEYSLFSEYMLGLMEKRELSRGIYLQSFSMKRAGANYAFEIEMIFHRINRLRTNEAIRDVMELHRLTIPEKT